MTLAYILLISLAKLHDNSDQFGITGRSGSLDTSGNVEFTSNGISVVVGVLPTFGIRTLTSAGASMVVAMCLVAASRSFVADGAYLVFVTGSLFEPISMLYLSYYSFSFL